MEPMEIEGKFKDVVSRPKGTPGSKWRQQNRNKQSRDRCAIEINRRGISSIDRRNSFYKDNNIADIRFGIPTANSFTVLERSVRADLNQYGNGSHQDMVDSSAASFDFTKGSRIRAYLQFFTVDLLENQLRIFNLTKYAQHNPLKSMSQEINYCLMDSVPSKETQLPPISPSSYIPPHRRLSNNPRSPNPKTSPRSPNLNLQDKPISVKIEATEEAWSDCHKYGVFAIWNGPSKDFPHLMDWLKVNCQEQVSIFHHSDNILYLKCEEEWVKKDFISAADCFFNGHCVKFVDWFHNFHLDYVNCMIPTWFTMISLPPELCDIDIIYDIGSTIGEVLAIDASFFHCNSIKILININIKHQSDFKKKIETGKAKYEIKFQMYKGKIMDILRSDDQHKIRPKILPLTSDFSCIFPRLSSSINSRSRVQCKKSFHSYNQKGQINHEGLRIPKNNIISDISKKTFPASNVELKENTRGRKDSSSSKK